MMANAPITSAPSDSTGVVNVAMSSSDITAETYDVRCAAAAAAEAELHIVSVFTCKGKYDGNTFYTNML